MELTFAQLIEKVNVTSAAWVVSYIKSLETQVNAYRKAEGLEPIQSIAARIAGGEKLNLNADTRVVQNVAKPPRPTTEETIRKAVQAAKAKTIGNSPKE